MASKHYTETDAADDMTRGYRDIPDEGKLRTMSYIQLSEVFHSCEKDSTKFHVIEREIKRHLAKDQAEINLRNLIFGACIGGIFSLTGVVLGYYLKDSPPSKQVSPSSVAQPASRPAPVQGNASPGNRRP